MEQIELDDNKVIKKRYRIRRTGQLGGSLETTIPREAFEREARRLGMGVEEAVSKLDAVWRFNNFHGLHLSFEKKEFAARALATETIAEYVSKRRKLEEAIHSKQGKTGLEEGSPSRVVKATSRRVDAE